MDWSSEWYEIVWEDITTRCRRETKIFLMKAISLTVDALDKMKEDKPND
jgi:hypothetical protein